MSIVEKLNESGISYN
jgi:hypothetical protein